MYNGMGRKGQGCAEEVGLDLLDPLAPREGPVEEVFLQPGQQAGRLLLRAGAVARREVWRYV